MTFQPVIAGTGFVGWQFLQNTYEAQFESFNKNPQLDRESQYFIENISDIKSAEDLVADRRLLSVALGAFGLQDDINNKFFIQKILQDGTGSDDALANRLADERYKEFSIAFGFGPGELTTTGIEAAMVNVVEMNRVQSFEVAVGEQDDTMRIALYAQRELKDLANSTSSDDAKWFRLMSLPPLRSMFETALGLPSSFGQLDIEKQLEVFKEKTSKVTGRSDVEQFSDETVLKNFTDRFLGLSQISGLTATNSPSANALTLLSNL